MKVLVIGFGSIGQRHSNVLKDLGHDIYVVSRRRINEENFFCSLEKALDAISPDYVVVANETSKHYCTLRELANCRYVGTVLMEKPLFDKLRPIPENQFKAVFVGYNLRFHPIIQEVFQLLINQRIIAMQVYVGQYLPTWRPETDYTASYSAHAEQGGGVLRDLSHELDYVNWLTGPWKEVVAVGSNSGHLKIDSDDNYSLLLKTEKCDNVFVHLNYLDRNTRRELIINTYEGTIKADLITGCLTFNNVRKDLCCDRNHTFRAMHNFILEGNIANVCSMHQGVEVLSMIMATEKSNQEKRWVTRLEFEENTGGNL